MVRLFLLGGALAILAALVAGFASQGFQSLWPGIWLFWASGAYALMSLLWAVGLILTPRPGWLHLLALWAPALGPFWMLGMAFTSSSDTEQGFALILFFGPAVIGFLVCLFGSLLLLAKFPTKQA